MHKDWEFNVFYLGINLFYIVFYVCSSRELFHRRLDLILTYEWIWANVRCSSDLSHFIRYFKGIAQAYFRVFAVWAHAAMILPIASGVRIDWER